ncbi:MAG: NMD3-related protein [Candidatus Woesearchaeota archaeon]
MRKEYHADYFQAIVQLRPADEELMKFFEKRISKTGAWISKKKFLKTGVDYYISSNKIARQIGKMMTRSFKGELKESKKLYSRDRQTSKNVYRVTVCFRLKEEED